MSPISGDDTSTVLVNRSPSNGVDFETAITATGFGKFNYILLLVALIASLSNSFGTTTMSYVVPVAECDLSLSLVDKGMLNGAGYLGALCSIFIWGFLADTYGRRNLLICGQWLDTIFNIGCVCSQSLWMLFIFKYLSGFTGSGPYIILMSYLAEFHGSKHRSRVMVLAGVFLSSGNAVLPFIAWWILPMDVSFTVFFININSWRLFLAICAVPPMMAAIGHMLLPETPKFLMSAGRNQEALIIFQKIYHINTGKSPEFYPVKTLVEEVRVGQHLKEKHLDGEESVNRSNKNTFRNGLKQIKTMFLPPHLVNFILVNVLQFGGMLGWNTLRLWLPQFFITIDEYQQIHNNTSDASLCEMLAYNETKSLNFTTGKEDCIVNYGDSQVYINSIIVSACGVFGYIFVVTFINAIGKRNLLVGSFTLAGITGIANYWSKSTIATLTISSIFITLGGIYTQVIIAFVVELFPTPLRTMVVGMSMVCGRIAGMLGNVLFPVLLEKGCLPPFLLIGGITAGCAVISLFLPKKASNFN